jgi:hypothetical protein
VLTAHPSHNERTHPPPLTYDLPCLPHTPPMPPTLSWLAVHTTQALYTFGQPRVGNAAFALSLGSTLDSTSYYRVVHNQVRPIAVPPRRPLPSPLLPFVSRLRQDPVVHIPPLLLSFRHAPTEVFYDEDETSYLICDSSGEVHPTQYSSSHRRPREIRASHWTLPCVWTGHQLLRPVPLQLQHGRPSHVLGGGHVRTGTGGVGKEVWGSSGRLV